MVSDHQQASDSQVCCTENVAASISSVHVKVSVLVRLTFDDFQHAQMTGRYEIQLPPEIV